MTTMFQFHALAFAAFCLFQSGALAVTVDSKCAPTCEGVTESGTQVMDPSNCVGYYVCFEINDEYVLSDPLECLEGDYFNINLVPPQCASIDTAHEGYCEGYCNPCEVQCHDPGTLRPDPLNCTQYYFCVEEAPPQIVNCPSETYFDYKAEICQEDENQCYSFCEPNVAYCVETGVVANPTDCQKYYYCDPPTLVPFTCNIDQHFDPDQGSCVDGPCPTPPPVTTTAATTTSPPPGSSGTTSPPTGSSGTTSHPTGSSSTTSPVTGPTTTITEPTSTSTGPGREDGRF